MSFLPAVSEILQIDLLFQMQRLNLISLATSLLISRENVIYILASCAGCGRAGEGMIKEGNWWRGKKFFLYNGFSLSFPAIAPLFPPPTIAPLQTKACNDSR